MRLWRLRLGGWLAAAHGLLMAGLVSLSLAACGPSEPSATPSAGTPSSPQRIVALAPGNVEILFALGLGDRVVGVGNFTSWPPEALQLPKLGGLVDADLEAIVKLDPDLLIALPSEGTLATKVAALGVEVLHVDSDNLDDVEAAIGAIAQRCGVGDAGERFLAQWRQQLAPRPSLSSTAPRVLLSIARPAGPPREIFTAGPGSFPHELLTRLGAVNVLADSAAPYPTVGLEVILARKPEVIIELRTVEPTAEIAAALRRDWSEFAELPAVRDGRIEIIAGSHTMIPGPRLAQLYSELAAALTEEFTEEHSEEP